METVIALPLYLLLLGGIQWIGQLIYDKQKLVVADRYVAWNRGNWHKPAAGDVWEQFFGGSPYDKPNPPATGTWSQGNWWHFVYGEVELEASMPAWTRGPLMIVAILQGGELWPSERRIPFYGRFNLDGSKAGGHSVVMRRDEFPGDYRDEQPGPDTDPLRIDHDAIGRETDPVE